MEIECPHILQPDGYTKSLQGKQIYKDQCVRCFHSPSQPSGLYVCLKCFNGFCLSHAEAHAKDHSHLLFVQIVDTLKPQEHQAVTKIAVGVEGGAAGGDQYETSYKVCCLGCKSDNLANSSLLDPQLQSLINTDSPFKKQSLVSWELEINPCEHTLTLQQEPQNKNLNQCSSCELSTNLWLCLVCGNTGCGRKNWDGTGGNSHGIEHYEKTKHPLVVKLGTITAEGEASLYCYGCNNDVKDPLLRDHLSVLGISIVEQKKTERTIAEMSLQYNLNLSLSKLVESKDDKLVYDFTGINNIGNSCYINSVLQMLNSLAEVRDQYFRKGSQHVQSCKRIPSQCFKCQISKIFWGLNCGKYNVRSHKIRSINGDEIKEEFQEAITPYDFKLLIANKHHQFTSFRQQDALEYLQHLLDRLDKEDAPNLSKLFDYNTANVLQCMQCNGHKIVTNKTNEWKVPVPKPTQQQINDYAAQYELASEQLRKSKDFEDPEYKVDLFQCLSLLREPEGITLNCPKCGGSQMFTSRNYFLSSPKYLLMVPNRFVLDNWVPKKLNAVLQVDEHLDISDYSLYNNQQTLKGALLKDQVKLYSEENFAMLISMGYDRTLAKKALEVSKDNLEMAAGWIMEHMDESVIDEPVTTAEVSEALIAEVMDLGFDAEQAKIALLKEKQNTQNAIEWLFSVEGDVSAFKHLLGTSVSSLISIEPLTHNRYALKAIIVHLGKSVHSGHYVSYIKIDKQWVLFNDEKVVIQNDPALGKGYLYVYEAV